MNRIKICGKNTMTLPTPAMTPSTTRLSTMPSGSTAASIAPMALTPASMRSTSGVAHANTAWNIDEHQPRSAARIAGHGRLIQSMSRAACVTTPEPGDSTRASVARTHA